MKEREFCVQELLKVHRIFCTRIANVLMRCVCLKSQQKTDHRTIAKTNLRTKIVFY